MTCKHQWVEERKRVNPPKHANFEIRFNRCSECGDVAATPEQRQKNKKHSNHAHNVYVRESFNLWGIQ